MKKYFKSFEIHGLHGDRSLIVEFGRKATILIGENGSGKTTALNALYAFLSGKFHILQRLQFSKIVLKPQKGPYLKLLPEDVESCFQGYYSSSARNLLSHGAPWSLIEELLDQFQKRSPNMVARSQKFRILSSRVPYSTDHLLDMLMQISTEYRERSPSATVLKIRERLEIEFPFKILYFPTYRRVEEELHQLGINPQDLQTDEKLIHFGMTDVINRFKQATSELRDSAMEWFARISGRMLSQLISGITVNPKDYEQFKNKQALEIVLGRVGDGISQPDKNEIIDLVNTGRIKEEQYKPLVYFLSNLVQIYDSQKEIDTRIKCFTDVVNRYLIDKDVIYDERKVQINVVDKVSDKTVELGRLSSGEKQMLSLFSSLYLSKGMEYAVLIDEPELSLSIEWQRSLLPDILDSSRCSFLVAATHSPFIFENELDSEAHSLLIHRSLNREEQD